MTRIRADNKNGVNSHPGARYGVPFPVLARASFGVLGANVAAVLRALAGDDSWRVREAVATNPMTPTTLLVELAADPDRDVRRAVAAHHGTRPDVLAMLANDGDGTVARFAVSHPALPEPVRRAALRRVVRQAARSTSVASRAAAAASPMLDRLDRRRRSMWQATEWWIRYAVAVNPATEADLLTILAGDGHRAVRAAARARLGASPAGERGS